MGRSSLLGTEYAAPEPAGRDTAALGPGDSSDSGSDLVGVADSDVSDPGLPVDVALRDDMAHSLPGEALAGSASDSAGTGERRSAGSDAGVRDAADIGVDRIITPGRDGDAEGDDLGDDEEAILAFIDAAQADDAAPEDDEDDEDDDQQEGDEPDRGLEEEGDNIPTGERGGSERRRYATAHAPTQPPIPSKPNPAPDAPEPPPGDDKDHTQPADEHDADERRPGRAQQRGSVKA